ncbi:MAG TPA: right-handed parallel beta-helix repeat-containing protein, partial [Thermoanaerobaculia bacterium]|nr:right-handed parallel beta-helix repeat-containing protein [Thermoanaerobaculia bacterium]
MHARPTLLAVASIALGNCLHASVAAPVFTVNSPSDAAGDANPGDGICETAPGSGVCTLRAALQESYITGAVINLPAYTITLQSQIFVGAAPTSLVGFGPGLSVISLQSVAMDGSARIFNLASGATLHLTGIRFTGGMSTGAASTGGAILGTAAAITITNCRFDANRAAIGGGAIYLADANAAVTMTGSTFDGNSSGFSDGGAIYLTGSAAALSITNSTFITNHAGYSGGAIRFYGPSATIADSVFTANQAGYMDLHFADAGHDGGALWVQTSLDVSGSTFTGNSGGLGG